MEEKERRDALAEAIREAIAERQSVREEQLRADQQHSEQREVARRQIDALQKQLASAEQAAESERQEIAKLKRQIAEQQQTAASAEAWIKLAAEAAEPLARSARERVERNGGSQMLRRTAAFDEALRQLADADAADSADGVRSLLSAFGEEWLPARSVTLTNDEIRLEGGKRLEHAWVVEVGFAAKAFVSERGDVIGVWTGEAGNPWKLDLAESVKGQVVELLNIARERAPPAVTPLPAVIGPAGEPPQ